MLSFLILLIPIIAGFMAALLIKGSWTASLWVLLIAFIVGAIDQSVGLLSETVLYVGVIAPVIEEWIKTRATRRFTGMTSVLGFAACWSGLEIILRDWTYLASCSGLQAGSEGICPTPMLALVHQSSIWIHFATAAVWLLVSQQGRPLLALFLCIGLHAAHNWYGIIYMNDWLGGISAPELVITRTIAFTLLGVGLVILTLGHRRREQMIKRSQPPTGDTSGDV